MIGTDTNVIHIAMELWGMIFCLISSLCIYIGRDSSGKEGRRLLALHMCNAFLLLADALSWLFRGYPGTTGYVMVRVSNFFTFLLTDVMLLIYSEFLAAYIGRETKAKKIWFGAIHLVATVYAVFLIISQFNHMFYYFDENNLYHRAFYFPLSQVIGVLGTAISIALLIRYRSCFDRLQFGSFISYLLIPQAALIIQIKVYGISLLNIAVTICVLWMYVAMQVENGRKLMSQKQQLEEQMDKLVEQAHEIDEMQRNIMMSQIQPHFLYNSLNTIYYLCEKDPEKAQQAVSWFSDYLRGNLDSLKCRTTVTFETELDHVKNYLSLEKMRYGDDLKIEYDIKDTDFRLPALSVQPLVENAVKYGASNAENGGTVRISSYETDSCHVIKIEDNGEGFDVDEKKDDGRSHVGIENVKSRLKLMSDAALEIISIKGKGTTAIISVPISVPDKSANKV